MNVKCYCTHDVELALNYALSERILYMKPLINPFLLVLTIAFLLTISTALADTLKAGASKRIITPSMNVYLAGLAENRISTGAHDDIYARCMMIDDGNTVMGIVSLDIIGLPMHYVVKIRQTLKENGINGENILLTCTHQHSGPDTLGLWGPSDTESGVNPDYMEFLCKQIVDAIIEANSNMQEATLKLSSIQVPEGVSDNSREPNLIDRELSLLKIDSASGDTIATLVNFTAHPETLWSDNHLITSDYPCYVYRDVEKALGGVTLFVNGALGGMVSVDSKAHTFEEAERIGSAVAEKAIEASQKAETQENVKIIFKKEMIEIPLENEGFLQLSEIGIFPKDSFIDNKVQTEVNYIRIGDAQIATFPGEALPKLGFKIKDAMNARYKFVFGLTNDELGYILAEEDFNRDLYKYEKSMSVGSKAGTMTTDSLIKLISKP
jgi:hypothetical protein